MRTPFYERDGITLYCGDSLEVAPELDAESVSAVVTDPPYGLGFMGKAWDHSVPGVPFWRAFMGAMKPGAHLLAFGGSRTYHRMGVAIEDAGLELRDTLMWLYGQGFPKSHNVNSQISSCSCGESASVVPYTYGEQTTEHNLRPVRNGDLSPSIDVTDQRREVLQPGVSQQGASATGRPELRTAEVRGGQSGVEGRGNVLPQGGELQADQVRPMPGGISANGEDGRLRDGAPPVHGTDSGVLPDALRGGASHRPRSPQQSSRQPRTVADERGSQDGGAWPTCGRCGLPMVPEGLGTALKPAHEPVIMARKPLCGTVAANVLAHGAGALNIDASRIGTTDNLNGGAYSPSVDGMSQNDVYGKYYKKPGQYQQPAGRWPANVILDEDAAQALDAQSGTTVSGGKRGGDARTDYSDGGYEGYTRSPQGFTHRTHGDTGGASRFFYVAKASRKERNAGLDGMPEKINGRNQSSFDGGTMLTGSGNPRNTGTANHHPTVKPLALMRYLVTLITPPGGIALDPFAGSGSTLVACAELGIPAIGIELSPEYCEIIARRVDHALNERAGRLPLDMAAD